MSSLIIQERLFRGVTILDLTGKITIGDNNRQLHAAIQRLVSENKQQVILNLAKITYIDSTGLGEVVSGYATLKANNGALKLVGVPKRVSDLMTITKLYTVFEIFDEEIDGVYSFDEPFVPTTGPLNANFDHDVIANSSVH